MKTIKTAVIPVAGMGTRFLPITKVISKEMLNILDRPLLDYAVTEAKEAGIEKFIFIVNKENNAPLKYFIKDKRLEKFLLKSKKNYLLKKIEKLNLDKKNIKLVVQDEPLGLANAILLTKDFVKREDFCVILPDDLIIGHNCTKELIRLYINKKANVIGVMEVEKKDVSKYGIIDVFLKNKNEYKIKSLIEKPKLKTAPTNLAIVGRYILKNNIFQFIKQTRPGSGGEIQLTDAIALSNDHNENWGCKFKGTRYDCGSKLGFLKAQIDIALKDKEIKDDVKSFINNLGK